MTHYHNIQNTRIQQLNGLDIRLDTDYVLYWMQQSQRAEYNHALEYAVHRANDFGLGVVAAFGFTDDYPEANLRHYTFMLEGLTETRALLEKRGIRMVIRRGSPPVVALELGQDAAMIVCDCGYLKHQRLWREQVARKSACRVVQVESDVIVPLETVSGKAEYAARTIRPKIQKHLDDYLVELKPVKVQHSTAYISLDGLDLKRPADILASLNIDRSVFAVSRFFKGGTSQAKKRFDDFIRSRLKHYEKNHNQPQTDDISHMSMYLHFGQISPLYLALRIGKAAHRLNSAKAAFLEELIVRRELAANFVYFNRDYDNFDCLPDWAQKTLAEHRKDRRPHTYTLGQLEDAKTHDPYWNAAMQEMKYTGFMHNYMRMYWGKKILEWSSSPELAFRNTLAVNNKYFLDGRDPNSYAGVAWIYGVHDRAWPQRPIYGKVRCMMASGLERKCDIRGYVAKVEGYIRK
ncbi:MAG: deoxyribodipyrimidine photo-lyase [Deltaproteobacteria bacterium]|nr:deoxyribodipyrimidine photo-lyase [Deltaproteobacteria bacterium]